MGGIQVDLNSKTDMDCLCHETGCNGVHGANRLASTSLLKVWYLQREPLH